MRSLLIPLALFIALPAAADPGSLKQAAVDQHRTDASKLLGTAKEQAASLRQRAGNRKLILDEQTKKTRSNVAGKLWQTRKGLRAMKLTLGETQTQYTEAGQTLNATKEELGQAKATMDASHGSLSWLARTFRIAITRGGRAKLAKYKQDHATHGALATRTKAEEQSLTALESKVQTFTTQVDELGRELIAQRGRDISEESEAATNMEIATLEKSAGEVESAARSSIKLMVSQWVKSQTATQRNPLQSAKDAAAEAERRGSDASSKIDTADRKIADAQRVESMNQVGDALEMLAGGNKNENGLFKLARVVGDVSSTMAAQNAQNWIHGANQAVEGFQAQLRNLSREAEAVHRGASGINGQADAVRANVTMVTYVDLVLNLTRFDGALTDMSAGAIEQIQLARASHQLSGLRAQVDRMRSQVKTLHDALGESLQAFDSSTGKIVDEAVLELVRE